MTSLSEAKKRDFVSQMISLLNEESTLLVKKGFDPSTVIKNLVNKNEAANKAETDQQVAAAKAQEATALSQEKLDEAYKEASNQVDLISGLLGKENELVKKMRKFRK